MLHSFTVKEKIRIEEQDLDPMPHIDLNGRTLLTPEIMKGEFIPLYGSIYLELWAVHYGLERDRAYTEDRLASVREL
jgi:hypothetical protein